MIAISGADWFSRRGGTCRLHAIFMNQPCIYMGKVGETVKHGPLARNSGPLSDRM